MNRADELIRLLDLSADYRDPNPGRQHITGLEHALRVATLASRTEDQQTTFCHLVHDLGRPLSDTHHGQVIAEIVRDRVSDENYMVLRTHGAFQAEAVHGNPAITNPYRGQPWTPAAYRLAQRELASFLPWQQPTMQLTMQLTDAHQLIRTTLD